MIDGGDKPARTTSGVGYPVGYQGYPQSQNAYSPKGGVVGRGWTQLSTQPIHRAVGRGRGQKDSLTHQRDTSHRRTPHNKYPRRRGTTPMVPGQGQLFGTCRSCSGGRLRLRLRPRQGLLDCFVLLRSGVVFVSVISIIYFFCIHRGSCCD
jgi:hypothetical protein